MATAVQVQELRKLSGAPILDCRDALIESHGDMKVALLTLRKKSLVRARKLVSKSTREGLILSYIHPGHKIGALVEVNCQTDFVARAPEFRELCKDIAMQVVASAPKFIAREDVPKNLIVSEICLLEQPFIKDPGMTVRERLDLVIGKLSENIVIRRFVRYELGEELGGES